MGELTPSLAHELNQPLTAILSNDQAAQRLLAADSVNLEENREILNDIVADDKRAGEVIHRLRSLIKRGDLEYVSLDLNEVVSEVAWLVRSDVVTGMLNKQIASALGVGEKTVKVHRGRVMEKMMGAIGGRTGSAG